MAEFKVVDVSAWQENINFKAVINEGVKAAIIRITERYNKTDSYFERNYTGFKNVGVKIGVYKFSYAMSVAEIQEEAHNVVSVLNGRELEYPVFLDLAIISPCFIICPYLTFHEEIWPYSLVT